VEAGKNPRKNRQAEFQKNSIAGLASIWSEAVAVYNLRSPDEDLERNKEGHRRDVNRVARAYLNLRSRGFPPCWCRAAADGRWLPMALVAQETISLGKPQPTKLPDWAESALSRLNVPDVHHSIPR